MKTKTQRRVDVLARLKAQLLSGLKKVSFKMMDLEAKDVDRIKKEISILESRIPKNELV